RRLLQALDELRRRTRNLGDAMRLVTFSADPDRTTDAQLLELAATYRARRGPWRFASGVPERVREILADFGVAEGESSTRVALVDENSMIRGYYDLSDGDALSLLLRDVSLLVARGD
ncbi:MAG TPA: hypothetical protein VMG12_26780, partial [Polyangiaceae bacterium]|nr:hypothetical protein [Polyangiaceae bacterium]